MNDTIYYARVHNLNIEFFFASMEIKKNQYIALGMVVCVFSLIIVVVGSVLSEWSKCY